MVNRRNILAVDAPHFTLLCLILLFYVLLKMGSMCVIKAPCLLGRVSALQEGSEFKASK